MILGHRPPRVTAAVVQAIQERGTVFALPTSQEITLAQRITRLIPSVEQVRLCNTGTEAVLYSLRIARTFTGRRKVIRFEGMYHGFSDGVYWSTLLLFFVNMKTTVNFHFVQVKFVRC